MLVGPATDDCGRPAEEKRDHHRHSEACLCAGTHKPINGTQLCPAWGPLDHTSTQMRSRSAVRQGSYPTPKMNPPIHHGYVLHIPTKRSPLCAAFSLTSSPREIAHIHPFPFNSTGSSARIHAWTLISNPYCPALNACSIVSTARHAPHHLTGIPPALPAGRRRLAG